MLKGSGYVDLALNDVLMKETVKNALEMKTSMLAFDKNGDILGARSLFHSNFSFKQISTSEYLSNHLYISELAKFLTKHILMSQLSNF